MLNLVKQALRTTTTASDSELENIIQAALIDLQFGGAEAEIIQAGGDALINQAVILYAKMNFGLIDPSDYDRLKKAYDEIKAQIGTATGYTNWRE